MTLQITLDHPTFLLKSKLQEVSESFLHSMGFCYFQYLRCYADGSIGLLTNDTRLFEHFQEMDNQPVVFSSFEEEHAAAHSYWFLWDEELPEMPVELARQKYSIRNGLTLVRRSKNYYDMIAVALPKEQENPGSFYLNKLGAIEQFVNDFDVNNKDLLTVMNKNPIALPVAYRDENYQEMCLSDKRIVVAGKNGMTYVTGQELECLRLLARGETHKQIAKVLCLSPRTIETYLQRIKARTGCVSKSELERLL